MKSQEIIRINWQNLFMGRFYEGKFCSEPLSFYGKSAIEIRCAKELRGSFYVFQYESKFDYTIR